MAGDNLKIAVGTTSELKLRAVKNALAKAQIYAEIQGHKVESGVPKQPFGEDQIMTGAYNRAVNALRKDSRASSAIGIESGIITKYLKYFDIAYCVVINRGEEVVGESFSATLEIPTNVVRLINAGEFADAGVAAQELGGTKEKDPLTWLSGNKMQRNELLEDAVFLALIRKFLSPKAYQ